MSGARNMKGKEGVHDDSAARKGVEVNPEVSHGSMEQVMQLIKNRVNSSTLSKNHNKSQGGVLNQYSPSDFETPNMTHSRVVVQTSGEQRDVVAMEIQEGDAVPIDVESNGGSNGR